MDDEISERDFCGGGAVEWIWFRHPGLQFVASLSPIEHLLTCALATFHEVASKPLTIDNGRSATASGI